MKRHLVQYFTNFLFISYRTTSEIMQLYLKQMLETFLHPQSMVRLSALTVVNMILRQGLVHPVQVITNIIRRFQLYHSNSSTKNL